MRMLMTTSVKVHSLTSYHKLLVEFEELLMELYAIKLAIGFQL